MDNMKHRRLQEMDRSDFGLVEGEPDIRGWDVKLSSGQKIGEVEDLIVDAQERQVRYMIVDRSGNDAGLQEYNVIIPIGLARLDQKDDDVLLPEIQVDQLRNLPPYDADHFDEKVEQLTCIALGMKDDGSKTKVPSSNATEQNRDTQNKEFYNNDYFGTDNLYKNRMHEAQPASNKNDDQQGLRLWELRSEGGVVTGGKMTAGNDRQSSRDMNDDQRQEMIRNRRKSYEDRRGYHADRDHHDARHNRGDNSISARIDREGLRDADR